MGRNALLIGLLLVALVAGFIILSDGPSADPGAGPGLESSGISVEDARKSTLLSGAENSDDQASRKSNPEAGASQGKKSAESHRLVIVSAKGEKPLAGIHAYQGELVLAGPSGADGILAFTPPPGRRTTFWAIGWSPQEFRSGQVPTDRVILHRADATLEVLMDNLAPDEGILQTRVEPMDWTATGKAAWAPPLEVASPGRAIGSALAPGRYQIYVWVGLFQAQGIALSPVEIRLEPGQNKVIRFDASDKPDDEVDS